MSNDASLNLSRRRRKSAESRLAERAGFLALIVVAVVATIYVMRPAPLPPPPVPDPVQVFRTEFANAMETQLQADRKREANLSAQMAALMAKPAAGDDAAMKKHAEEVAALKKELEELKAAMAAKTKSIEVVQNAAPPLAVPVSVQPAGVTALELDVPKANAGGAAGATAAANQAANEKPGGGGGGGGGGNLGGLAAAAAAAAAAGFPAIIPILIALGIGGDLFGTDYKDGQKVVAAVVQMFEQGAEIQVEEAVNKIVATSWADPTDAIGKLTKALRHPEMRKRLGEAKAKELESQLDAVNQVYTAHTGMLVNLGREATMRLLTELPPVLAAGPADQAAMTAKFQTLLTPFGSKVVQADQWRAQVGGYINAALSGPALQQTDEGLIPFRVTRNDYIDGLIKLQMAPPPVVAPNAGDPAKSGT